jgi:hypothetical protein
MKRVLALSFGAALALVGCGQPLSAPPGFPPEVEARIERERQACTEYGMGALEAVPLDALQRAELNADGAPDYLLSHGHFRCADGGAMYCGSAGCSFTVFMSQPGGSLSLIEMGNVQAFEITRDGDRDVIDGAFHGSLVGAETEYARMRWDGAQFVSTPR